MNDEKYIVKSKTLLPVHVGGGAELLLDPLSYTMKDGWFYSIHLDKMFFHYPDFAKEFVELTEKENSIIALRNLIVKTFDPKKRDCWNFRSKASTEFEREFDSKRGGLNNQLLVQCMMHTNNRPIIPGSSIKGAMRTAILDERVRSKDESYEEKLLRKTRYQNRLNKEASKIVEGEILMESKFQISKDPFRGLKTTDAILPEDSTEIVQIYNVNPKKDSKGIPMWVEVVKQGVDFSFELAILNEKKFENTIRPFSIQSEEILDSCFDFFMNVFYDEVENFYTNSDSLKCHKNISEIKKICENIGESNTLLRIGRFSHLESMTFSGKLRQPQHEKGWGKTRNLINGEIPLGMVICNFEKMESK
jgi:CRISPR-associated protein Csm5